MTERLPPELLLKNLHPDFRARHLKERREKKATLYEFVEGARTGDIDRFSEALRKLGDFFDRALWRKAMRGVARIRCRMAFASGSCAGLICGTVTASGKKSAATCFL